VPGQVSFPEFVFAFYTTPLFKLERLILQLTVARPSTERQVRELADGSGAQFAAWKVERRSQMELLMCDMVGRTRSWLMALQNDPGNGSRTKLYFGSAIVPRQDPRTGNLSLGVGYQALLGFHQVYSALLLYSAKLQILSKSEKHYAG
jgi:hypothetical protein